MNEQPVFGDCYRIVWRRKPPAVAEVRNYLVDGTCYRRTPVVLDDALIQGLNQRFLASSWGEQGPQITVSDTFMALPIHWREAAIWHEVGHIHYEHPLKHWLEDRDQAQLRAARILAIENGQVMPDELEADRFAVERAGKDTVLSFLELCLRSRPRDAGYAELERRISTIRGS